MATGTGAGGYCPSCVFLLKGLIHTQPDATTWDLWERYMAAPDPAIMDEIFRRPPDVVSAARDQARAITTARAGG